MENNSPHAKCGCGLIAAVFRPRRGTLASSAPNNNNGNDFGKASNTPDTKRLKGESEDAASLGTASSNKAKDSSSHSNSKPIHKPTPIVNQNQQMNHPRETAGGTSKVSPTVGYANHVRRVPKEAVSISGELESMIADHQKSKGSSTLVRASSSNVMLYGNLGNLRQGGNTNSHNVVDYHAKQREENPVANGRYTNHKVEHVDKGSNEESGSLCRALSTRMDPEQLKIMGNEDYKNGRFAEALALYDAAIALDPNKASFRSNRSAALTALGRLLEAVFECREAIRIEPHYHRAHHRLGNLNMRLGETDKALYHCKNAGPEADPDEIAKVKNIQLHLNKCTEARRLGDWNTLIMETNYAISSGADSAPQIFALQAEAFLKLRKHQDADEAMSKGPNFDVDECTKFFGPIGNANLLVTRAQVHLAAGRYEDALDALQRATRLDSNNKEVNKMMRKARAVASARSNGNELFKASKFSEACVAYGEGLEHDPYNSVLLCNRAACRSKLGQFEKAVEDCTAALNLRPSYSKARLRRADCNAKLKRWEASIQDYEILLKETPDDEEVSRALLEAKEQLQK
ncbi:inactive TPR repeat-containing thioredoxin TTL3-like [Gastrolobium bilobum]|uniref:inactive TPR repeat-containing thioredoxin TTL3-like n=1 Tax=Gastrolobium bilobum TaxID=150636 RepID=UPI002AB2497C|nr:inactive TPR repeat-containing thioredoxin TTL3-like [Gastrolobium bilobum]